MPVFIAGDFNEDPSNEPICEIMNSKYDDLYSLISNEGEKHPAFTTFKYREKEGWVKRTIDYIFLLKNKYSLNNGVTIKEYLDPGDLERDRLLNSEVGNPCPTHPSDHYSIGYKVEL